METVVSIPNDDENQMFNHLPESLRNIISNIPDEILRMDEKELAELTPRKAFTAVDLRLRVAFWKELNHCFLEGKPMRMTRVYTGVCTNEYFYAVLLKNQVKVAHMIKPIPTDERIFDEMGYLAQNKLRELVNLDYIDSKGKVDAKLALVVLKASELVLNRAKGIMVQKNLNVNVSKAMPENATITSIDDIDKELARLEAKKEENKKDIIPVGVVVLKDE